MKFVLYMNEFSRIFTPANRRSSSCLSESYNLGKGKQEDQVVQPGQGRALNHRYQVGMTPWIFNEDQKSTPTVLPNGKYYLLSIYQFDYEMRLVA